MQVPQDLVIHVGPLGNWVNADRRRCGDGGWPFGSSARDQTVLELLSASELLAGKLAALQDYPRAALLGRPQLAVIGRREDRWTTVTTDIDEITIALRDACELA